MISSSILESSSHLICLRLSSASVADAVLTEFYYVYIKITIFSLLAGIVVMNCCGFIAFLDNPSSMEDCVHSNDQSHYIRGYRNSNCFNISYTCVWTFSCDHVPAS